MFTAKYEVFRRERNQWRYEFTFDFELHDAVFATQLADYRLARDHFFDKLWLFAVTLYYNFFALTRIQLETVWNDGEHSWRWIKLFFCFVLFCF